MADILEGAKSWSDAVSLLGRMHKCFCKVELAMKCYSTSAYFLRGAKNVCVMQTRFKNAHFFCLQQIFIILSFSALGIKAVGIYGDSSRKVFGMATAASTHLDGGSWPDYSFKKPASLMHMNSL